MAARPDGQHQGRGPEARLEARLHQRRRVGGQAGRRRAVLHRPEGGRDLAAPAGGEAAGHRREVGQAGRHPGVPARPQRRPEPGQGGRGLRRLHRLRLRRGGQAGRRVADRGDRRQGQHHPAAGDLWGLAGQRPAQGLRGRHQGPVGHEDPGLPGRGLQPRQGPPGDGDPAAGSPGRGRRLRAQRRDGHRGHRRPQGRRPQAGPGRDPGLDRRRAGRPGGDRGRRARGQRRVQPAVRAQGGRDHPGVCGRPVDPAKIINPDKFFDASNAKENIAAAY